MKKLYQKVKKCCFILVFYLNSNKKWKKKKLEFFDVEFFFKIMHEP